MNSLASQALLVNSEGVYRMDEWDADSAAACLLEVRPYVQIIGRLDKSPKTSKILVLLIDKI